MSRLTGSLTATQPSTTYVQSLVIRLDGITAGDYLAWVRDPEPPTLDRALRSVATSADPLGELLNVELVWAGAATDDAEQGRGRCRLRADPRGRRGPQRQLRRRQAPRTIGSLTAC
jgi:hypothetical protein